MVVQLSPNITLVTGYIKDTIYSIESSKEINADTGLVSEVRKVVVIDKLSGTVINKFEDFIQDVNIDRFVRTLDNKSTIHYSNGEQTLFTPKMKPVTFISTLPKDTNYFANFVSLDLETCKLHNGNLFIESAAISDGKTSKSWHIGDYTTLFGDVLSCNALLKDVLESLMQFNIKQNTKTNGTFNQIWGATTVYIHNFSRFDAIFIIKFLVMEADRFKIKKRDSSIINITFTKKYHLDGKMVNVKLVFLLRHRTCIAVLSI